MGFAIVVNKPEDGRTEYRADGPLTPELKREAEELDDYIRTKMQNIERALIDNGFLQKKPPKDGTALREGDSQLWYAVGTALNEIIEQKGIDDGTKRKWLWMSLDNIHVSNRLKRKHRGKSRNNFEYYWRLSQFPEKFALSISWSQWVQYFDSRKIREDERIDDWLRRLAQKGTATSRKPFRKFIREVNACVKNLDTSVLADEEINALCDSAWAKAEAEDTLK